MNRRFAFRGLLSVLILVFVISSVFSIQRKAYDRWSKKQNSITRAAKGNGQETSKAQLGRQLASVMTRKRANALTPTERKIDARVLALVETINKRISGELPAVDSGSLRQFSDRHVRVQDSGEIEIDAAVDSASPDRVETLRRAGLRLKLADARRSRVRGWVRYDSMKSIAQLGFVKAIERPNYPRTRAGRVANEGNTVHRFDIVQSLFFNNPSNAGSGVKIGVISDNISNLNLSVASGGLPNNGDAPNNVTSIFTDDQFPGDEGTALIEVIHDVAPGATIEFDGPDFSSVDPTSQGFVTGIDMVSAIKKMQADDCQIIVDDVTFLDEPKFQDGDVANEVRNFVNAGGVYVTSAGNDSLDHYIHGYTQTANSNTFSGIPTSSYAFLHNFGTAASPDVTDTFTLDPGDDITVALQWSDAFGNASDDFDLFLVDMTTNQVIAQSSLQQTPLADPNNPSQTPDPSETLDYTNNNSGPQNVGIVIGQSHLVSTVPNITFNYIIYPNNFSTSNHQFNVPNDAVTGHSAVTEAIVVGAADSQTPLIPEPFTSQGPATILFDANGNRLASPQSRTGLPAVVGVDDVSVRIGQLFPVNGPPFFFSPFFGTSASAPQVAGLAALILSRSSSLTGAQVKTIIANHAIDMGAPGPDNQTGSGLVDGILAFTSSTNLTNVPILGLKEVDPLTPVLSFSTTTKGIPATQNLTLVNYGGAALTVNTIGTPTGPYSITAQPGLPLTLQPGQAASSPITVKFNPTSNGSSPGSFIITSTDPAHGTTTVNLSGTGVATDSNDNCANPTVITSQAFTITQDTTLATTEGGDPTLGCAGSVVGSHSVWFKFKAKTSGQVTLNTFGSSYDTILDVFTGSCNAFSAVACNDDSPTQGKAPQSELSFSATAGTTYLIEVAAKNGGSGGTLTLSGLLPITPPGDAELLVDDGTFDQNDNVGLVNINVPSPFWVASRLTPASYPATLDQIKLEFLSGNGVNVGDKITLTAAANPPFSGPTDLNRLAVSSLPLSTIDITIPVLDQYFSVPAPSLPPINSGDFVVGYKITVQPGTHPIPEDTTSSQRASYLSLDGINFDLADNDSVPGNWAIRALVKVGQGTLAASNTDFGPVLPNTGKDQVVSISNTGTNDVVVPVNGISTPTGAFTIPSTPQLPLTIPTGGSLDITVHFLPTSTGPFGGSFNVTNNGTTTPFVVNLTGTGAQPNISVTGTSFGNVTTGKPAQQTVTITNSGTADLHISAISNPGASTPSNGGAYGLTGLPSFPATITAGNHINITATLTPGVRGSITSNFTVTSDAPGSPTNVQLSANGVSPTFTLNPSPVTFTNILQNGSAPPVPVTLQNNGPDALVITAISTPAPPFSVTGTPTLPLTVAAGNSTPLFTVNLNTANSGTFNSSIIITSNGTTSPNTLNLSASIGQPQMSLSATSFDFGPFKIGRISTKTLTITNTGTGTLTVTLGSPTDGHFTFTGIAPSTPTNISANGGQLQVSINFAPDGAGPFSGTIAVTSNSATNPNPTISLSGSGSTVNHPPSGNTLSFTATLNTPTNQKLTGTDPDNDPLTFAIVTSPTKGNITNLNATTGTFTYTATSTGSDSFTFKVNDGVVDSSPQTVTITNINFISGDLNGDQQVSVSDLVILANIIAGNITPTPVQKLAGDVFQDGQISIQDLVTLANFIAGNIHTLPVIPGPMPPMGPPISQSNIGGASTIGDFGAIASEDRWWISHRWLREPGYLSLF